MPRVPARDINKSQFTCQESSVEKASPEPRRKLHDLYCERTKVIQLTYGAVGQELFFSSESVRKERTKKERERRKNIRAIWTDYEESSQLSLMCPLLEYGRPTINANFKAKGPRRLCICRLWGQMIRVRALQGVVFYGRTRVQGCSSTSALCRKPPNVDRVDQKQLHSKVCCQCCSEETQQLQDNGGLLKQHIAHCTGICGSHCTVVRRLWTILSVAVDSENLHCLVWFLYVLHA